MKFENIRWYFQISKVILDFSRRSLNSLVSVATCQGSAKIPKRKTFHKKDAIPFELKVSYSISNPTFKLDNNCFVLVIFFKCAAMIRRIFCGVYRLEICLVRPASRGAKQRNLNEDKTWAKYFNRWQQVKICPNIWTALLRLGLPLAPNMSNLFCHFPFRARV